MNSKLILNSLENLKDQIVEFAETKEREQPITMDQLPDYVLRYRKRKDLSRDDFGAIAGVSKNVVIAVERGKETIKLESLLKVINTIGLKILFHA
jgi:HTH-type transcriptional regulator / antitoxin HipB